MLGYGRWSRKLNSDAIDDFLRGTEACAEALESYEPESNARLFACLDELVERVAQGAKKPEKLAAGGNA